MFNAYVPKDVLNGYGQQAISWNHVIEWVRLEGTLKIM